MNWNQFRGWLNGGEMNNFQGEIWKEIAGSHFGAERVIWHIVNEMEVNSDNKFDRNSNNTSHSPPWQSHPCSCRKPSWRSRMTWVSWWSSPWSSCHRLQPDGSPCALVLIKMCFDDDLDQKCCLIGLGKKTDEQTYTYALVLSLSFTVSSIFRTRITCLSPFYWRQFHVPQRFQSIPTKKWTRSHLCPPLVKLVITKCTIDNIKCNYANALIFRCKSTADLACFKQTDKIFLMSSRCGGWGGITKNVSWSDRKNRSKID